MDEFKIKVFRDRSTSEPRWYVSVPDVMGLRGPWREWDAAMEVADDFASGKRSMRFRQNGKWVEYRCRDGTPF